MWSRLQSEADPPIAGSSQDSRRAEISQAWNSLNQTKAALRHIENRLQATPGGAVRLELLQDAKKTTVDRRKRNCRDANHVEQSGSKSRSRSRRSSDKTSRSPLRNSSLDHNAQKPSCVEPREPLASFRDASPHPVVHANSHPDAEVGISQPSSSDLVPPHPDSRTRVARLAETESTSSAAPVRYLNDFTLHQPDQDASGSEVRPRLLTPGPQHSDASQPTERKDLEEAEERPVGIGSAGHTTTVKVRSVARAPPAPVYKGFSCNNRSVRASKAVGSVWEEQEFQKYSREVYRDLTQQLTGGSSKAKLRPAEPARVKEKKLSKLVRKVHRSSSAPDSSPKPVINTSAWREGQKLIKMVLGPPHTPRPDPGAQSAETPTKPGPAPRVSSAPPPRPTSSTRTSGHQEEMLSANIRSILDDLQMDRGSQQASGARKSRSTSPAQTSRRREAPVSAAQKKRHYDAEAVRLYISQKQEERRRQQAEERRAQREEEEKKSKRLQELYRRQRAGAVKEAPIQKQLQETYTRLLLEQSQLREDLSITHQVRPVYQPSGESDKENKRHERPHSATSSSDRSFTEQRHTSFSRGDVGFAGADWPQTDPRLSTGSRGSRAPSSGHILSRLIEHDPEPSSAPDRDSQPALVPLPEEAMIKMSRIEALRATAASLSCRVESEARRLAAAGRPVESISGPVSHKKPAAPVTQNQVELVEKLQELLAAGQATHTCAQAPGDTHQASSLSHEAQEELSDGSISEGLLSEDSASDQELQELQELPRSSGRLITAGFAPDTLARFQKEAEKHKPFSPAAPPRDAHGAWEELAKGSPHSAINIFIKNMQGFVKEREGKACLALGSVDGVVYEDDFNSCGSSRSASRRSFSRRGKSHGPFSPPVEMLSGRSAGFDKDEERSQRSQTLTPLSSHSLCSAGKIASEKSGLKEARSTSALSDLLAGGLMKSSSEKSSSRASNRSLDPECFPGGTSAQSIYSLGSEGKKSPRSPGTTPAAASPAGSASSRFSQGDDPPPSGASAKPAAPCSSSSSSSASRTRSSLSPRPEHRATGSPNLQFAPRVLQQRLSAELCYMDAVEETVRQLGDVERVRGVSLAQQETVSLAQILKSQQQKHERDLYLLRVKAEQEALETQRRLEESRQRAARAHAELQGSLLQSQQQALGGLHEATNKMIHQQAEAARHTAETAQHIKEMTELARSQIAGAMNIPAPSFSTLDHQRHHSQRLTPPPPQPQPHPHSNSSRSPLSPARPQSEETPTDSLSDSIPSRRPTISGGGSSISISISTQPSPPHSEPEQRKEPSFSSVEDQALTAVDDSLCSPVDQKDCASVATEYSLKFDDSMTEDEMEEKSFRSLLPSEAHRRESLDRKPSDEQSSVRSSPRETSKQDSSMPFSSGQNRFSKFTMDLVRQYMKEEEVRAQHQSSLLRLRDKALREKTNAELAWLEHQKRRLRGKGEDDKMPPLRKRQRGLILKLQQEQAEIKQLQEANKAARRERQLLFKQQEEIERMRHTTLRIKERLKNTTDADADADADHLDTPVPAAESLAPPSVVVMDGETRSPSPVSVSGSETSSIMQKLKKMRSQMDEKHCSPVHYFFSVFTAHHWASLSVCLPKLHPKFQLFIYSQLVRFLTRREQQLMQRRRQAEELLEWRRRLDEEEAEVRRVEKKALEAWEKQKQQQQHQAGSEKDDSVSHTHSSVPEIRSPPPDSIDSERSTTGHQKFSSGKAKLGCVGHSDSSGRVSGIRMQVRSGSRASDPPSAPHTDVTSDQSDVESRICALKEELRKRKSVVCQLKKEQKKRQKERLKAQEASLLKQLQSYNDFIQKTKAELSQDLDANSSKPPMKTPTPSSEKPWIKTPPTQSENFNSITETEKLPAAPSEDKGGLVVQSSSEHDSSSDEDPPTVTTSPVIGSPEHVDILRSLLSPINHSEDVRLYEVSCGGPEAGDLASGDESVISSHRASVIEELEMSEPSESEHSEPLLKLDLAAQPKNLKVYKSELDEIETRDACRDVLDGTKAGESSVKEGKELPAAMSPSVRPSSAPDVSKKKDSLKTKDHGSAHDYTDDFETSLQSSFKDLESFPPSPSASQSHDKLNKSLMLKSEEEIEEQISAPSRSTNGSHHAESHTDFGRLVDQIRWSKDPTSQPEATTSILDELPGFFIGDRVLVSSIQPGTLRFKGQTSFANGFWAGVELNNPEGSNNGTYDGVAYFQCRENYGIFAPPDKISHLPEKFETLVDSEDEDSSCDDQRSKGRSSGKLLESRNVPNDVKAKDLDLRKEPSDEPSEHGKSLSSAKSTCVRSQNNLDFTNIDCNGVKGWEKEPHSVPNGGGHLLDFASADDAPTVNKVDNRPPKTKPQEEPPAVILDLLNANDESQSGLQESTDFPDKADGVVDSNNRSAFSGLADKLVENLLCDTLKQLQKIKRDKEEKISAANQSRKDFINEDDGLRSNNCRSSSKAKKNHFHSFYADEQEELSSPEHCNRPESPVLGSSGQEELAKRLAELELNRELFDVLGDEPDWFDEDFGLSSKKQQQKHKLHQQADGLSLGLGAGEQVKTPPRPELPLQMKPPEEPPIMVPHTVPEVEKLVREASQEIWKLCRLDHGRPSLAGVSKPRPSSQFLGQEATDQDEPCQRSYKLAIFDLSWEIIQDICAEDPKVHQPQWMKPPRLNSAYFHRVKFPSDITTVQDFVTAEVLKLCGLKKESNPKTDLQKMIKFGRKKRDRVDHILVQELHEEESQWVNYDEDELFVKMQLADGIFDALLKDTVDTLIQTQARRPL